MISKSDFPVEEAIKMFSDFNAEVSFVVPTKNMLKKSTIDATDSVRDYFKKTGLHDYSQQQQGPDHKKKIKSTYYVTNTSLEETETSVYRPETKEGDPRLCIYRLRLYASPNNLLALLVDSGKIYVINMSVPEVRMTMHQDGSPLNKILNRTRKDGKEVADELLEKLKKINQKGFIEAVCGGDTAIGRTLEKELGIEQNPSKKPDYRGIELKSTRKYSNRTTLFSQVPIWKKSCIQGKSQELLKKYGYFSPDNNRNQLYCTIRHSRPNPNGFYLSFNEEENWLNCLEKKKDEGNKVVVWKTETLKTRLKKKHNETFWVKGKSKKIGKVEYFWFKYVYHTRAPMLSYFEILIKEGLITLDFTIYENENGSAGDHGYLFRMTPRNLPKLFGPANEYSLSD